MLRFICVLTLCLCVVAVNASEPVTWQRAIDRDDAGAIWRLFPDADIFDTNEKGKSALMSAARLGDHKLYMALKSRGLSASDRSKTGGTVLMYAALGNQLSMIRTLHSENSDPGYLNARSENGWTAVMIAAAKGFDESVQLLVKLGADPTFVDVYQWSPLMRAIDNQHTRVVQYLLSLPDININAKNENGLTALHVAVLKNDAQSIRLLLDAGIDRSLTDARGKAAADIARVNGLTDLAELMDPVEG